MRLALATKQRAMLCGNVLAGLGDEDKRFREATCRLLPFPVELSMHAEPLLPASYLAPGVVPPAARIVRAARRDYVHSRLFFRAGEELPWEKTSAIIRTFGNLGRIGLTKLAHRGRIYLFLTAEKRYAQPALATLRCVLPGLEYQVIAKPMAILEHYLKKGDALAVCHLLPQAPYWRGLPDGRDMVVPPVQHELNALAADSRQGVRVIQTLFEQAPTGWLRNAFAAQGGEREALERGHIGDWAFEGAGWNKDLGGASSLYATVIRCGATGRPDEAESALAALINAFAGIRYGGQGLVGLDTRAHEAALGSSGRVARMLAALDMHAPAGFLFTEKELAQFFQFPVSAHLDAYRIDQTAYPPPSRKIQEQGTQVGWQYYAGRRLAVRIPDQVRARMVAFVAKTGAGKTEGLINLIMGDIERERR